MAMQLCELAGKERLSEKELRHLSKAGGVHMTLIVMELQHSVIPGQPTVL